MNLIKRVLSKKHVNSYLKLELKNLHVSIKNKTAVNLVYQVIENDKTKTSSANPIIISHGLMGQSNNWKSVSKCLLQDLNPSRKIYVIDNRNHGDSPHTSDHSYELMSDDTIQLYSTLRLTEAVLLGHSMGGRAFMHTALTKPEKVSSLILVDISPIIEGDEVQTILAHPLNILKILSTIDLRKQKGLDLHEGRKNVDNELKQLSINSPGLRPFILQNLKQNSDGSWSWKINIPTLIERYSNFKMVNFKNLIYDKPVLIIAGEKSNFVPKSHIESIKKIFPHVRIEFVPNAGHLVHMEYSQIFCEIVIDFLKNKK